MMRGRSAWLLAFVYALVLPMPGPHVDAYTPMGWVLLNADADATRAFWILFAIVLAIYTIAVRAIIAVVGRVFLR